MRAVWLTGYGPPGVLRAGEAPDPAPGPGQVLVQVAIAGVTFIETWRRAGRWSPGSPPAPPIILGNGVGGRVAAVGPGVRRDLVGHRVVTSTGGLGGYAELAVAAVTDLVPVPDPVELPDAVALLADGRTAIGLIRLARPEPGQWVLVEAAGGGVGSLLVQLARRAGARVAAAAGSRRKLDLARELGADVAIDYTAADWAEQVRTAIVRVAAEAAAAGEAGVAGVAGVDLTFDSVGGAIGRAAFELTAAHGRFVMFGLASGAMTDTRGAAPERGPRVIGFDALGTIAAAGPELTAAALAEAAAGRLRPVIGQTFPLDRAADAHAAIEARATLGKTLLVC
jgi:NADPH2:quinone reductase